MLAAARVALESERSAGHGDEMLTSSVRNQRKEQGAMMSQDHSPETPRIKKKEEVNPASPACGHIRQTSEPPDRGVHPAE